MALSESGADACLKPTLLDAYGVKIYHELCSLYDQVEICIISSHSILLFEYL